MRATSGVKLMDNKTTEELMARLTLDETLDKLAKANGVYWYGQVLRREDDNKYFILCQL